MDKSNTFPLYFVPMLGGMLPLTLLAYDEKSKWTKYSLALPYRFSQIVSSKYAMGIMLTVFTSAVSSVVLHINGFSFAEILIFFGAAVSMALTAPAVCLPFSFKFGVEKGRIAYYVVFALIVVLFAFLGGSDAENASPVLTLDLSKIVPIAALAVTVLYILSCLLSVRLSKTKEA